MTQFAVNNNIDIRSLMDTVQSVTLPLHLLLTDLKSLLEPIDGLHQSHTLSPEGEKLLEKLIQLKILFRKAEDEQLELSQYVHSQLQTELSRIRQVVEHLMKTATTRRKRLRIGGNGRERMRVINGVKNAERAAQILVSEAGVRFHGDFKRTTIDGVVGEELFRMPRVWNDVRVGKNFSSSVVEEQQQRMQINSRIEMNKFGGDRKVRNDDDDDRSSATIIKASSSSKLKHIDSYHSVTIKYYEQRRQKRKQQLYYDDDIDTDEDVDEDDLKSTAHSMYSMLRSASIDSITSTSSSSLSSSLSTSTVAEAVQHYNSGLRYEKLSPPNVWQAVKHYRTASDLGHSRSKCRLATLLQSGIGLPKDLSYALKLLEQVSQAGHPEGQCLLALAYARGMGVKKDNYKATELYMMSSCGGNDTAALNLGVCYQTGTGVEKSMFRAVNQYRRSAALGNARACYNFGVCYERGDGVDHKDIGKAARLYGKAAKAGCVGAMCALGVCYERGAGVRGGVNYEKAFNWYGRAILESGKGKGKGKGRAEFMMGRCYEGGLGVEKHLERASQYYATAVEAGNVDAKMALQNLESRI